MKRALQIILAISLFGVAFSGVLSYRELSGLTATTCPSPGPAGTVLGYPACVYGFFMYLVMATTSAWGLAASRARHRRRAEFVTPVPDSRPVADTGWSSAGPRSESPQAERPRR